MSQAAFLRAFDAAAFGAFAAAGLADTGAYLTAAQVRAAAAHDPEDPESPALPTPASVDVLVDRNVEDFGEGADVVSYHAVVLRFRREQIEPAQGATCTIGGDTYTLVHRVGRSDESLSSWAVQS